MPDFNQVLTPGDQNAGTINTVIEIPEGSVLKIEWDRKRAAFTLDRVEPKIYAKPVNYGFIPGTLDDDGDELDTLVISPEPIPTGVWLEAKVLGVLNFIDDGDKDYKILCVPVDDRNSGDSINTIDDVNPRLKQQIEEHFKHYKDLKKPGTTVVEGWGGLEDAKAVIKDCIDRYNKR